MFCFIQLLQRPLTHPLLEMGIYMFASMYQRTQHRKPLQQICKGRATFLNLSGQGGCVWNCSWLIHYIVPCSRQEAMAPSRHLYHTATVRQPSEPRLQPGIPDPMQAKGGVCCVESPAFEASKYCPILSFWSLVVFPYSSIAASLAHELRPALAHKLLETSFSSESGQPLAHPVLRLELHGYKPYAKVIFTPRSLDALITSCPLPFW